MKLIVTNVFVDDQEKALRFYTETLGFENKTDISLGDEHRWLTVVGAKETDGVELLLEPSSHPAVSPFKQALVEDGIPYTAFGVSEIESECRRLKSAGVQFTQEPTKMGTVTTAVFNDNCGNLIQIVQQED